MKTTLISILLFLIIITNTSKQSSTKDTNIDTVMLQSEKNLKKATTVTQIADQQQKKKIEELYSTIDKLKKEKYILQRVLKKNKTQVHLDTTCCEFIP
jgi:uncharacterized protein YxeA